jgi:hypothetical protein
MEIRATLRLSLVLVTGILITSVLDQVMTLDWLPYLAVMLSGALFMNLWWIAICCFAYWSEKQEISMPVEKSNTSMQQEPEPESVTVYEVLVPSEMSTGPIVSE